MVAEKDPHGIYRRLSVILWEIHAKVNFTVFTKKCSQLMSVNNELFISLKICGDFHMNLSICTQMHRLLANAICGTSRAIHASISPIHKALHALNIMAAKNWISSEFILTKFGHPSIQNEKIWSNTAVNQYHMIQYYP